MATVRARYNVGVGTDIKSFPSGTTLFSDGFESGNCSAWTAAPYGCNTGEIFINTNRPRTGTYSMEIHYATTGPDLTRYLRQTISPAQDEMYIRGYVYFQTPTGDVNIQRKLWFINNDSAGSEWSSFLTSDTSGGVMTLRFSTNNAPGCGVTAASWYTGVSVSFDTWHHIEQRIKLNTPGSSNGEIQIWLDGANLGTDTGWNLRGTCSSGVGSVHVGAQISGGVPDMDEYRYWDDIVMSTGYVGI